MAHHVFTLTFADGTSREVVRRARSLESAVRGALEDARAAGEQPVNFRL